MNNKHDFGYVIDLLTSRFLNEVCPDIQLAPYAFFAESAQIRSHELGKFRIQVSKPALLFPNGGKEQISYTNFYKHPNLAYDVIGENNSIIEVSGMARYVSCAFHIRFQNMISSATAKATRKSMFHSSNKKYFPLFISNDGLLSVDGKLILTQEDLLKIFNYLP